MKRTFGIVIILSTLFITALSGCNEISSTPQLVSKAEGVFSESLAHDESSEAKEAKTEFYIGETAELDKVQTTLIDVTESTGSEYNQKEMYLFFVNSKSAIILTQKSLYLLCSASKPIVMIILALAAFLRCSKKAIKTS